MSDSLPLPALSLTRLRDTGSVLALAKVEPQPVHKGNDLWYWPNPPDTYNSAEHLRRGLMLSCPHAPGDRVWIPEVWRPTRQGCGAYNYGILFRDLEFVNHGAGHDEWPDMRERGWRPAATMPEWAARTFATVTEVLRPVRVGAWCYASCCGTWVPWEEPGVNEDWCPRCGARSCLSEIMTSEAQARAVGRPWPPTTWLWRLKLEAAEAAEREEGP